MDGESQYTTPDMTGSGFSMTHSVIISEPKTKPPPKGTRKFCFDFLNWGNIFQSFIGSSILSLPFYCYKVYLRGWPDCLPYFLFIYFMLRDPVNKTDPSTG